MGFGSYASSLWAAGRFNGSDGATQSAEGMTCVRNAAGDYTITLEQPIEERYCLSILPGHNETFAGGVSINAAPVVVGGVISTINVAIFHEAAADALWQQRDGDFSLTVLSKR